MNLSRGGGWGKVDLCSCAGLLAMEMSVTSFTPPFRIQYTPYVIFISPCPSKARTVFQGPSTIGRSAMVSFVGREEAKRRLGVRGSARAGGDDIRKLT